jgi:hypothetical protein
MPLTGLGIGGEGGRYQILTPQVLPVRYVYLRTNTDFETYLSQHPLSSQFSDPRGRS